MLCLDKAAQESLRGEVVSVGIKSVILPLFRTSAFQPKKYIFLDSIFGMLLYHARLVHSYVANFKELWFIPDNLLEFV